MLSVLQQHDDMRDAVFQISFTNGLKPKIPVKFKKVQLCSDLDRMFRKLLPALLDGKLHEPFSDAGFSHRCCGQHSADTGFRIGYSRRNDTGISL